MDTSDESFLFTSASSDSSDMELENEKNYSEPESFSGNAYKKKLQNELQNTPEEKGKSKKRKRKLVDENGENNDFRVDKSIKSEPNSDFDTPVKKKRKRHDTSKDTENHLNESYKDAEDYLNLRVKQEQMSFTEPIAIKSKKKKKYKEEIDSIQNNEFELNDEEDIVHENHLNNVSPSRNGNYDDSNVSEGDTRRRKKKKKKRNKTSESHDSSVLDESEDSKSKNQISTRKSTDNSNEVKYNTKHNHDNSLSLNINNFSETHTDSDQDHNKTLLNNTTNSIRNKETSTRAARISDRIRFEDDSVDYDLKDKVLNNIPKKLKNFQNANPHLTPLHCNAHKDTAIAEDDEVWIVRGPHELSIDDFENVNLSLLPKAKVKLNGKSYDSIINDSVNSATIVSYNNKETCVKNVSVIGIINLQKRIPKVHIPYEEVITQNQDNFIPLPDTKCRHPLFGINFKKATKIPRAIVQRLNTEEVLYDIDDDISKKKKKKKKKEKIKEESDVEEKVNLEALEATSSSKKKRKRKHDAEDDSPKKAKRIKQDPDCAESWESEQAIEKKLFSF